MKSPKLPAKGKCRVMWANMDDDYPFDNLKYEKKGRYFDPVAVASLSPEACEARVEEAAKAIHATDQAAKFYSARFSWMGSPSWHRINCLNRARAVLASAGLLAGGKKGAGK